MGSSLRANVYLKSKFYPGFVTINGKRVTKADIKADNGVIHMVSDVIYPIPTQNIAQVVTGDDRFSTLLAAVGAAGLAETLAGEGPFTVFAPTNDALAKVLLRHVVPGTLYYRGICWKVHSTAGGNEDDEIQTQVFKGGVVKVVSTSGGARVQDADILATNGVI